MTDKATQVKSQVHVTLGGLWWNHLRLLILKPRLPCPFQLHETHFDLQETYVVGVWFVIEVGVANQQEFAENKEYMVRGPENNKLRSKNACQIHVN